MLNDSTLSNCIPHLHLGGQVRQVAVLTSDLGRQLTSSLLGGPHQAAGSTACADHRLPSTIQRDGGEDTWSAEGRLKGKARVLLGLRATPKEDCGVSAAEMVYGAALSLLAEFLSTGEPPAGEILQKLHHVDMPATRPLSYAKVAAKPPAALLQASHMYVWRGGTIPPLATCTLHNCPFKPHPNPC
jgi:hypothetical protein